MTVACRPETTTASDLRTARPIDGFVWWNLFADDPAELLWMRGVDDPALDLADLADLGEAAEVAPAVPLCRGAADRRACLARATRPPLFDGFVVEVSHGSRREVGAWTSGDELGFVRTPTELLALLGPIDTPTEAVLVATHGATPDTYRLACVGPNVTVVPEGFLVRVHPGRHLTCPRSETRVLVARDGSVTPTDALPGDPVCPTFEAEAPPTERDFDRSRREEERLATRAVATGATADWLAYLGAFPSGPRSRRAVAEAERSLLDELRGGKAPSAAEGSASELETGALLTTGEQRLLRRWIEDPQWTRIGGEDLLSVELHNDGYERWQDLHVRFQFLDANGQIVAQHVRSAVASPPRDRADVLAWEGSAPGTVGRVVFPPLDLRGAEGARSGRWVPPEAAVVRADLVARP